MNIKDLYSKFNECSRVVTDSRSITGGEMFFGLKGENFDGNEYAASALGKGARWAVVDEGSAPALSGDKRVIAVPDTLAALQSLARYHRENTFVDGKRLTVLGLTGTNGKTTTKELITRVLFCKYRVTATAGNLNNDIGVPLSLLSINEDTQIAVIEMGASHPDDIAKLVRVCLPDYGIITNVGKAHLLGFGSFEGVKKAKGALYDHLAATGGFAFVNSGDPNLLEMASERPGLKVIEYSLALLGATVLPSNAANPFLRLSFPTLLETHLAGSYNATNVAAAIAVGLHFGVSLEEAIRAISEYIPTNNRSQMENTGRNIVIEDAYNANPTSMEAALDNLASVQANHKAALLGEMRELGEESFPEHVKALRRVLAMKLDLVCLVGEEFAKAVESEGAGGAVKVFPTSDELAAWLKANPISGATVLVKGSRGTRMEKTLPGL